MLRVAFKIIEPDNKSFLAELKASIEVLESDDLELNVRFVYFKEYKIPYSIFFNKQPPRLGECMCRGTKFVYVGLDMYINTPRRLHIIDVLYSLACEHRCSDCRAFLSDAERASGYSGYLTVFNRVGNDIMSAYRQTIAKAEALRNRNNVSSLVFYSDSNSALTRSTYTCSVNKPEIIKEIIKMPIRRVRIE